MTIPASLLTELRARLGVRGLLEGRDTAGYVEDWRGLYRGRTPAVIRPENTAELAGAVRLCAQAGVAMVPQGGNTSMVGGATPSEDGRQLVVSIARMNRVRALDARDLTMTLDAGMTLKAAQQAASAAGCLLPLSIASEGSAQIGGVLATNAGGNNTLRYGNARDLVLGLEVVLPDGTIWNGLRRLRKDNTGYCLRQLFVGSEGTLGFITAAVLKLVPAPARVEVALCAVPSPEAALELFGRFTRDDAGAVVAFEYMCGTSMALVLDLVEGATLPLAARAEHYTLVELATSRADAALRNRMEGVLEAALADGVVSDAALADSNAQRAAIWRLREEHSEAQKRAGASVKNDVSVPVSSVPALIAAASAACAAMVPGLRIAPFGHLGDGNIHFNLVQPAGMEPRAFLAQSDAIILAVNAEVRRLGGSFSAEHGIGRLKSALMEEWRGGAELDLMRRIKAAIDPSGLMNPGKLLP